MTLDDIAEASNVSRYHLSRAFSVATGYSVMQYVRGRRLTEAARSLASGASDILTVALDAGYGSHEAFTRAFRDQFGLTPEAMRARADLSVIERMEPIRMDESLLTSLNPPRFENAPAMLIVGSSERYTAETCVAIPAQWQRFVPHIDHIPARTDNAAWGVVCNADDLGNMDYICGVQVSNFAAASKEFSRLKVPPQRYAVFSHRDHISTIRRVWHTIFNKWLPESGEKIAEGPELERYGEEFNSVTGAGGFEIWIPLKAS